MPIWARAIIFGIELVGYILLSIYAIKKFYEEDKQEKLTNKMIKSNLKFNIIFCSVFFAFILALFLFTFPSYVFFSYNKLLLVSVVMLLSVSIITMALTDGSSIRYIFMFLFGLFFLSTLVLSACMPGGYIRIDNKVAVSEPRVEKETIIPTMFSENQIGKVYDAEGNFKNYIFYYKVDDVWNYKELDSDTKNQTSKNEKTYIEKTVTKTNYCKQEKKTTEEDYSYIEEKEEYIIYIHQTVDVIYN